MIATSLSLQALCACLPLLAIALLPVLAGANLAFTAGKAIFGKNKNRAEDPAASQREKLIAQLMERLTAGSGAVTDTPVFRAGAGALKDALGEQAGTDNARATALGLAGTETEIAQTAGRTRALAGGLRGLTATAAGLQQQQQSQTTSALLSGLGQSTNAALSVQGAEQQRQAGIGSSLASALQAAVLADFHSQPGAA